MIGPAEVSCNGNDRFIHDIYVKNMPKSSFYSSFRLLGHDNIFSTLNNADHLRYKKMLRPNYSKSAILRSGTRKLLREKVTVLLANLGLDLLMGLDSIDSMQSDDVKIWRDRLAADDGAHDRVARATLRSDSDSDCSRSASVDLALLLFLGTLEALDHMQDEITPRSSIVEINGSKTSKHQREFLASQDTLHGETHRSMARDVECFSLFGSLALDVVSAFELGPANGTALLSDASARGMLHQFRLLSLETFWTMAFPPAQRIFTAPSAAASSIVDRWLMSTLSAARDNLHGNTSMETLREKGVDGDKAFSLLSDNLIAGHETSAIALTYICYELSRPVNRARQERLREEVAGLRRGNEIIDDLEEIDKLPFLDAVLNENFRVHTSGAGSMPRVCPSPYKVETKNGHVTLPVGTTISCQAYSFHRQEHIFPRPHQWEPERWLQQPGETPETFKARRHVMQKQMLQFGRGVRMCLGRELAILEIKMAVANIYGNMQSEISPLWCTVTEDKQAAPVDLLTGEMVAKTDEQKMAMLDGLSVKPRCEECYLRWTIT